MAVAASRIFEHLEQLEHGALSITRHDVACNAFTQLRRSMYALVIGLRDEEAGDTEHSDRLRQSLSEWLTVPLPFADLSAPGLDELGMSASVGIQWGDEMRRHYDAARQSLAILRSRQSPLRVQLGRVMHRASIGGLRSRIYCHRSAAAYFFSCAAEAGCSLDAGSFLHSLRDYRNAAPFDLLIKVGPLRSRGWGSLPGACLNAPRYHQLVQVVWTGISDEPGFGDDPVVSLWGGSYSSGQGAGARAAPSVANSDRDHFEGAIPPSPRTVVVHADPSASDTEHPRDDEPAPDELQTFARLGQIHHPRRAVLLCLGDELGVLYPPHSEVLLLTPGLAPADSVSRCTLAEVDPRGRYLIRADIGDVHLGGQLTGHGWFSTRWKAELKRQLEWHPEGLVRRLFAAGIRLKNLRSCVEHWIQPASTVIHAPQQRRHFELLIEVLEMEMLAPQPRDQRRATRSWWRSAWQEVAESRGQAIQFGMQEQEIIGGEVDRIVLSMLPEIRDRIAAGDPFRIGIPAGHSLEGSISFLPIREVEEGFCVPDSSLKTMIRVSRAEEWRA
jgi:hypothetical protein